MSFVINPELSLY